MAVLSLIAYCESYSATVTARLWPFLIEFVTCIFCFPSGWTAMADIIAMIKLDDKAPI